MNNTEITRVCIFCKRPILKKMDHHLVPKSRGGRGEHKIDTCRDCHKAAHALFSNKELEQKYNTPKKLMSNQKFRAMVAFIAKQDPTRKVRMLRTRERRRDNKYR